jgi:hypothetical protein
VDPVLERYITGARRDPATFGVLLHGSRVSFEPCAGSNL